MTPEEFDAHFDRFRSAVVRLESLPAYNVGGAEAARIAAWREGRPRPERSVRTDPWLARIAVTTTSGKSWLRVRVVDDEPTEYQRYRAAGDLESQAAGEQILIAERSRVGDAGPDFWLFDPGAPDAHALVMRYDPDGRWLGADLVTDHGVLAELDRRWRSVREVAAPLNVYLAGQQATTRA